jgi:hypothetical protein
VQVATISTSGASPDSSGTQPVRVGANARVTPPDSNFFTGEVDEVRVWNDDLSPTEVSDAYAGTSFNTGEQVPVARLDAFLIIYVVNYNCSTNLLNIRVTVKRYLQK